MQGITIRNFTSDVYKAVSLQNGRAAVCSKVNILFTYICYSCAIWICTCVYVCTF